MRLFTIFGLDLIKDIFGRNGEAKGNPNAKRINRYGRECSLSEFTDVELAEDDLVNTFVDDYLQMNAHLKELKEVSWSSLLAYLDFVFEHYQVSYGREKQTSLTFTSINQRRKVVLTYADMIKAGSELMVAKALLDKIIDEKSEHVDSDTQTLLRSQLYMKNGDLSISGLLAMRNKKLSHPDWPRFQDLIADALKPVGKKGYIRVYQRESIDPAHKWEMISLDYSAV